MRICLIPCFVNILRELSIMYAQPHQHITKKKKKIETEKEFLINFHFIFLIPNVKIFVTCKVSSSHGMNCNTHLGGICLLDSKESCFSSFIYSLVPKFLK